MACLSHWGRVTHICVSKLTSIGSYNGLSPCRRQAIIWTNAGILLIGQLGTKFSEILIEIYTISFKKMHLKMSSGKCRPFCLGLNVLNGRLLFSFDNGHFSFALWYSTVPHFMKLIVLILSSSTKRLGAPWWRYQIETFSALLAICAGNLPVIGEFLAQMSVTRNFEVFFDLRLYKHLTKQ